MWSSMKGMLGMNQAGPDCGWAGEDDESRLQRSDGYSGGEPRALPWAGMNDAFGVRPCGRRFWRQVLVDGIGLYP